MKKIVWIIIYSLLLTSCKTHGVFSYKERRQLRDLYVYSFKITYFKKMLISGYRNSTEIMTILDQDFSSASENVLSLEDYSFIDSIVKIDQERIVADSANSIGRMPEGAVGKKVFKIALERYESKWLDDVAKRRSKAYTIVTLKPRE